MGEEGAYVSDFFKEHIKTSCPKCQSEDVQLASMGHPMPFVQLQNNLPKIDENGEFAVNWSDEGDDRDIWWGGDIVFPGQKTDFNRRCKDCYELFKV